MRINRNTVLGESDVYGGYYFTRAPYFFKFCCQNRDRFVEDGEYLKVAARGGQAAYEANGMRE